MITRSKVSEKATVGGNETQIAASLKDGYPMMFWYFVKLPCGGWREFDLREVCAVPGDFFATAPAAVGERLRLVAGMVRDSAALVGMMSA